MFSYLDKITDLIQKMIDINWKIHKSETDGLIYENIDKFTKDIDNNFTSIITFIDDINDKIKELELEIKNLKETK